MLKDSFCYFTMKTLETDAEQVFSQNSFITLYNTKTNKTKDLKAPSYEQSYQLEWPFTECPELHKFISQYCLCVAV